MNQNRAQEILKHITQDKDFGVSMFKTLSLSDSIYVVSDIIPSCVKKAIADGNENDEGYFNKILRSFRPIVVEKIKTADKLWIVYCESTGYPYELDQDMIVLFDYANHKLVTEKLEKAGFKVATTDVDQTQFKNEVAHMYRNGYKAMRFMDGKSTPYVVEREEFYPFSDFYTDEYITNPALEYSMISFFQEFRKQVEVSDQRAQMLKTRENAMAQNMLNGEFMVPCIKTETEEEVEISHPYVNLKEQLKPADGKDVIAIPAFTDGFELDKCYEGKHENMLYSFKELTELVDELGAHGMILNCLGISYYMPADIMHKVLGK